MGDTTCYAMVRGSAIRITALDKSGSPGNPVRFATSKAVADITINETVESGSNELIRNDEDDISRLHFVRASQLVRYTVDVNFLRTDPGVLSLMVGMPLVLNAAGDVAGFDMETRRPAASFALEVWSKLSGEACADGVQRYGYTVLPFLKGGYTSGFAFKNGLVSFNLRGAQSRRVPRWGVGPFDLEGPHERLIEVVSRNTMFRQTVTTAPPPAQANGVQETEDIIYGGTATVTTSDVIDGGSAASTDPWIIYGGRAV